MAQFDAFLVANAVGTNRKLRRLSPAERWCVVAGVWALASMSPIRGYLLVADGVPATAEDFAEQAGVSVAVARATLAKMRTLGMLERDPNLGAEHVHAWHDHQPEPSHRPSDTREAWRERKARQRARDPAGEGAGEGAAAGHDGHAAVTRDRSRVRPSRHAPEEKGSEANGSEPPRPPASGGRARARTRAREAYDGDLAAYLAAHPVTAELCARWEPLRGSVAGRLGGERATGYLATLHPHSLNGSLVLGTARPELALVIQQAIGRAIEHEAGLPLRILPCGCEVRRP